MSYPMPREASPLWRRAFDTVERAVGPPLERGMTSSEFARSVALARRLRRAVGRGVDSAGSWALHQVALPSHEDVRRLRRQLARVERELGALRRELDEKRGDT
jgi:hypothetical protein